MVFYAWIYARVFVKQRQAFLGLGLALTAAFWSSGPELVRASQAAQANVLILLSDDQGWVDAGFQGSKEVSTPHLDSLARVGVRCTSGYASHPFCSPTRAGLLTGRYQARFGHEFNPVYDPLDEREGLPLSERLLPQLMKDAGYATGWVGKWHLGSSPAHCPWRRGFDETFGFIGGGHLFRDWQPNERQYTLPLTRNGEPLSLVPPHLTVALGNEAAKFIRRHPDQPWMLYVAFNAPHTPHEPTAEREAQFMHIESLPRRRYLAQVSLLDDAIGEIMAILKETNQTQKTLVFFVGDNGGSERNAADNGPLRGEKGQVYEGGVRVPFVVSYPGQLPAGKTYEAPVSSLDVVATSLAAAGRSLPADKKYDSVNLLPYLRGDNAGRPHERLFWRAMEGKARAVRERDWKLVRLAGQADELYDLASDLGEAKNLAADQPEVAAQLSASLASWEREMIAPVFLGSSVKSEDWGPGGANQKNNPKGKQKKPAR